MHHLHPGHITDLRDVTRHCLGWSPQQHTGNQEARRKPRYLPVDAPETVRMGGATLAREGM